MNDLVNTTPCAVSDSTTTKLQECKSVIRMWQAGENQEASRKVLILLSLLKQCCESRDMMLFFREPFLSTSFWTPAGERLSYPCIYKGNMETEPSGLGEAKRIAFVHFKCLDGCRVHNCRTGLFCFCFVNSWICDDNKDTE